MWSRSAASGTSWPITVKRTSDRPGEGTPREGIASGGAKGGRVARSRLLQAMVLEARVVYTRAMLLEARVIRAIGRSKLVIGAPRASAGRLRPSCSNAGAGTSAARGATNLQPARPGRRLRRLGLRARVTAVFALGALLVSTALAGITFWTARQYFLRQRESTDLGQAYVNASFVRSALRSPNTDIPQLLDSVDSVPGSHSILYDHGHWFSTSLAIGRDPIPPAMQQLVSSGSAATQRYLINGSPELAIGLPIPSVGASYFEVFSLEELSRTLHILLLSLEVAAIATTLAGAIIGRWASGRVLGPLAEVASAAAAISGGRLDTRVQPTAPADLALLASSFNQMADRLQERIEREARFTSDVSHELRSPLTTLSASLGVLEARSADLPARSRQALALLSAEVRRFQDMVSDLLEISRFDAGSAELNLEEVEVGELVRHAVATSAAPRLPTDIRDSASRTRVRVDKRRMERVLANLIENAESYAGGVSRVTAYTTPTSITFAVEDRGPGVPPEERSRIFERFYRGQAGRARGEGRGAGLGLSLVAEHVRLHGGAAWVEAQPDGPGSRFLVELPLLIGAPPDHASEDGPPPETPAAAIAPAAGSSGGRSTGGKGTRASETIGTL